ncbi:cell cycle [Tyrophagus putrescentiae]|nr:cell cycle [Tyrophagus putrescentiae]
MTSKSSKSRTSSRLAHKHKNGDKPGEEPPTIVSLGQNGQPLDEIDMISFPICGPDKNKKVNSHNFAEIPSIQLLQSDDDNSLGGENASQNSESADGFRKNYGKRKNANSLIESKNKFRQLLNQIQIKSRPMTNGASKCDSQFDGYELKSRRVRYQPRRSRHEMAENNMNMRNSFSGEYLVKVLDKTIDLTPYCKRDPNKYVSLYPICRMWARNNYGIPDYLRAKRNLPPPPMTDQTIDPDGPYSDTPVDIYHMPKPEPMPVDEEGNVINIRIPQFVREFKPPKTEIADHLNSMEALSQEELLALNMPHWKFVRREFLKAARQNEARYHHSFLMLKSMFEKANHGDHEVSFYKNPPYETDISDSPVKGLKPLANV